MTDFHKLLIVKIKKKTRGIFLVVYVIYDGLLYTDSKKAVSCFVLFTPLTAGFIPFMQLLKGN